MGQRSISSQEPKEDMMKGDWIKRVWVVGAGTMGHSLAMVFAQAGHEVDLVDVNPELFGKALSQGH
jgi:3-hydroxyacyl-CoA dehydrogenase